MTRALSFPMACLFALEYIHIDFDFPQQSLVLDLFYNHSTCSIPMYYIAEKIGPNDKSMQTDFYSEMTLDPLRVSHQNLT